MQQMGNMISQANDQLADLTDSFGERAQISHRPGGPRQRRRRRPQRTLENRDRLGERPARTGARRGATRRRLGFTPAPAPPSGGDHIAELERLAKLRDSGALTDAELEHEKAKILGS